MAEITFDALTELMRSVFNSPRAQIQLESTSATVLGWDSVAHVILMLEIEQEFGVAISPHEAAQFENVGRLYEELIRRRPATPLDKE